jgi:multidrug resistance efflux pump
MMRKGDVLVQIDLREAGVSADAAKKMAQTIAGHL